MAGDGVKRTKGDIAWTVLVVVAYALAVALFVWVVILTLD